MKKPQAFDAADYLDSDAAIVEYLNAALEDENPDVFLQAVADVATARGMSELAHSTGLGRESLHKALTPGAKSRYDTVLKLLRALGIELHATATHAADRWPRSTLRFNAGSLAALGPGASTEARPLALHNAAD